MEIPLLHFHSINFNGQYSMLCFRSRIRSHHCRPRATSAIATPPTSPRNAVQTPYWDSINVHIATHLEKSFPARAAPSVSEPLRHLTLASPRSPAPALCVAACELVGGMREPALNAAAALHLTHAAAFAHGHLPRTDRPGSRPGSRMTAPLGFGPNIELLTGDGMIALALELLARSGHPASETTSDRVLRAMVEITRAIGSQGVVSGQYYREISGRTRPPSSNDRDLEFLVDQTWGKMEGGFHACAGACGAILGGGTEEEIERLRAFGYYVGMIQGISTYGYGRGNEEEELKGLMEDMRRMAVKNLRGFNEARLAEEISSIVREQSQICYA